jgi:Ca2+-binding RTX toxin-like protein/subtilisin-like proprotein convertase family protein
VNGNDGADTLNVDDTGDTAANTGTLTSTRLTGIGMAAGDTSKGITYGTLEDVNIGLGSGGDTFTIESTHSGTTDLFARGGADVVNVRTTAGQTTVDTADGDDTINVGSLAPVITRGTLNGLAGLVIVRAGNGSGDTLNVDDSGDGSSNTGEMTATTITGLGMGGGIQYHDLETLNLWLGSGSDTFTAHSTHSELTNLYAGAGHDIVTLEDAAGMTNIYGEGGNDTITVDTLVSLDTGATGDTVNLDGQVGGDYYIVNVTGTGDYIVNVIDTGTGAGEVDTLTVNGTSGPDNLLLRASAHAYPKGIAFVAALHGDPVADVERVNYNKAIEQLVANGNGGDDIVTLDDVWARTTVTGGEGKDTFQVGQIFKSERDAANANIAVADEFATTLTTRGYLSNGITYETSIEGNGGSDVFVVFRNLAQLRLYGGDGDDSFTIRAFALEGSHTTELTGEGGADYVEYVLNAPVNVLGGDGVDSLKVIGTEFSDQIVITATGIFGMGINVTYGEIEKLEIDGAEGNDLFYVLSTAAGVETYIYGGLGSDRFSIAGDVPQIMSGSTQIYPATSGSHELDGIQGLLHIDGLAGAGSAGGLGIPVMLPGETNGLPSTGGVLGYTGTGTSNSIDTMTVATADLQAFLDANTTDSLTTFADLVGLTLEISAGPGMGRFWQITGIAPSTGNTVLTLKSPAMPAAEWTMPNTTSRFAITRLSANFFVNETGQVDFVTVYNDAATVNQSGTLTASTFSGFGMGTGGITYGNLEVLDIFLGSGADTLTVTGTMKRDDGFRTITVVSTGAGNDVVTVTLLAASHGFFALNTEAGNDHVHASTSTLSLVIFGGAGDDWIQSGSGNDIVFGDLGRVDYRNASGTLITRLGLGLTERNVLQAGETEDSTDDVPFMQTNGGAYSPVLITTRNAAVGGADDIAAGGGDNIVLGGAAGDTIDAGNGTNIVVGDHGTVTFASAQVLASIVSTNEAEGGADKITLGTGTNTVVAGTANDTVVTGQGTNVVLGDSGSLTYATGGWLQTAMTTTTTDGGVDDIDVAVGTTGNWNLVLGGAAGDTIDAGNGTNIVVGDHGTVTFASAQVLASILSTNEAEGGADKITLGAGTNTVVAGTANDTVVTGQGTNVVLGDSGSLTYATGGWLQTAMTTTTADGGVDDIDLAMGTTGNWNLVLGGAAGDTIDAGSGTNIVLGDHGTVTFASAQVLASIVSTDEATGGADTITLGAGTNTVVAGTGNDTVVAGQGTNVVLGDSGSLVYAVGGWLQTAMTTTTADGGVDDIDVAVGTTGNWNLVLGGAAGDTIDAGSGTNIVLGDHGIGTFQSANVLASIESTDEEIGGDDTIYTGIGPDIILGGVGNDIIDASRGEDSTNRDVGNIVLGDNGRIDWVLKDGQPTWITLISTMHPTQGGSDDIRAGAGNDIILGGTANDTIRAGAGNDLVFGDHGEVKGRVDASGLPFGALGPFTFTSIDTQAADLGGDDIIHGGDGDDILIGGQGADTIYGDAGDDDIIGGHNVAGGQDTGDSLDGGTGNDVITGDNAVVLRRVDALNPRFRALIGTLIYDALGNVRVASGWQQDPKGTANRSITILDHSSTPAPETHGNDYIAGGPGNDMIFGQLGDDIIQGDGSIDFSKTNGLPVGVTAVGPNLANNPFRDASNELRINPSFESPDDGDDYIEGNGGNDIIFGGLGQDDIVGGSSTFFGLDGPSAHRPDGSDLIFGGAGTDLDRNDRGDGSHACDADVILGDNANIYRLVGVNGQPGVGSSGVGFFEGFLSFNYDRTDAGDPGYSATLKLIPRAVELLDYTVGGPDYAGVGIGALGDIGAADELHGEAGDDAIYGMVGNDVIYGEAGEDDLIGGWGHDWISGGSEDDGILGDDGRIFTRRNSSGYGEPLYGIQPLLARDPNTRVNNGNVLNEIIYTPGKLQQAVINVEHELTKTVILTPFNVDPGPLQNPHFRPGFADDILYGGLGNDFMHGGPGDDLVSGAEALAVAWFELFAPYTAPDGERTPTVVRSDYTRPYNPGNALGFEARKAEEFAAYDEYNPLRKILLNGGDYFANFGALEGPAASFIDGLPTDGNDRIFGDLGRDWLVGGTGRDHLYGGYGNDLINADDNHDSTAATGDPLANNIPDTAASYEDIAYGGAGRDVLIANTGGDRLIDWVGEFNSYIVPFAPFGAFAISRMLSPQLMEYLYVLSAADGADATLGQAGDPRNGEPYGELGLVMQKDFDWHAQTGAPDDPQPGNIPGGSRDVLRGADFNNVNTSLDQDGTLVGFAADSGAWRVEDGRLSVSPEFLGGDAASVFYVDSYLPTYFEVRATINAAKPLAGWKSNAYIIFDYVSPTDFKFAGVNISTDKIEMGRRTAAGWIVDVQTPAQVRADRDYNLLLSINGAVATLVLDNAQVFSYAFAPTVDAYGVSHGLNRGMVGLGANNSTARIDNLAVQILPPQLTLQETETFNDGVADRFTRFNMGSWQINGGEYHGTPAAGQGVAISTVDLPVGPSYLLRVGATLNTEHTAGIIFDQYADDDFKFAAVSVVTGQVILGHYTARGGWKIDAAVARPIAAGQSCNIEVTLKGTTVNLSVDGQVVLGFVYNALVVDGGYGVFTRNGQGHFDTVTLMTNDPDYEGSVGGGAPVAMNDAFETTLDTALVISHASVLANDSDPDGDALSITAFTQPANGTLLNNGTSWTYTPNAGYLGVDRFTYTIADGEGGTSTATVAISVRSVYASGTYTGTGGAIKDAATTTFSLPITDAGTIRSLTVQVATTHPARSELTVTLIGPDGTRMLLALGADGTVNMDLSSTFAGRQLKGTWKLEIKDSKKKNLGTLDSWSLAVEYERP